MIRSLTIRRVAAAALVAAGLLVAPAATASPRETLVTWGLSLSDALGWLQGLASSWLDPSATTKEGTSSAADAATSQEDAEVTADAGPLIDPNGET